MYLQIDELRVKDYTNSPEIYRLEIRTENRTRWIYINGSEGFKMPDWGIQEAVDYYLSENGKNNRMMSFYKAWGFYD